MGSPNTPDERDALELVDGLRRWLADSPDDQLAREELRSLVREMDGAALDRPIELKTWNTTEPPSPRRWLVNGWLPAGRVTLLVGQGGVGKSRLAMQLAAGIASGGGRAEEANQASKSRSWIETPSPHMLQLGEATEPGGAPVVYASWEDEWDEFRRRLSELSGAPAPWVAPERLSHLHFADMAGHGALWGPRANRRSYTDTMGETTQAGHELRRLCSEEGARLLIVDPSAAAYGSDENNRTAVRAFLSDLDAWARENDCAILILSHPSKGGADYSGSSDWQAGVRSMWTLRKEKVGPAPAERGKGESDNRPEGWQLALTKANYGPPVKPLQMDWDASGGGLRWKVIGEWSEGASQQTPTVTKGKGRYGSVKGSERS